MIGDNATTEENGMELDESFLDLGVTLDDIPDLELVPDNTEVMVRLTSAKVKESNAGNKYIEAYLSVDDDNFLNARAIRHMMMLPGPDTDKKRAQDWQRNIKEFAQAFAIRQQGTALALQEAVQNQPSCWAIIGIERDKNGEYPDKNKIKRFVIGK